MARQRMIKPDIWSDEKFMALSLQARLLFIGMWNFTDDKGVIKLSPAALKARIFPSDNLDVTPYLMEIISLKMGIVFTIDGENWLWIRNFLRHQKINRPVESSNPPPPEWKNEIEPGVNLFSEYSVNDPGVLNESSVIPHAQVKISKVKISKVKISKVKENIICPINPPMDIPGPPSQDVESSSDPSGSSVSVSGEQDQLPGSYDEEEKADLEMGWLEEQQLEREESERIAIVQGLDAQQLALLDNYILAEHRNGFSKIGQSAGYVKKATPAQRMDLRQEYVEDFLSNPGKYPVFKDPYTPEFKEFLSYYPLHVKISRAFSAWNARLKAGHKATNMILSAKRYRDYCKDNGVERRFMMHPSSFLGAGADPPYKDYLPKPREPGNGKPKRELTEVEKFGIQKGDLDENGRAIEIEPEDGDTGQPRWYYDDLPDMRGGDDDGNKRVEASTSLPLSAE